MSVIFGLLSGLGAMIGLANKKYGKINSKKINFIHISLMVLIILMLSPSLNLILQLILNFEEEFSTVYIKIGFLNPLVNTILWAIITIVIIIIVAAVFIIAGARSEKARKPLITMIPILFTLELIRIISAFFSAIPGFYIGFAIVLMLILYVPMFFFYRNENVKNIIFNNIIKSEEAESS